MNAANSKKGVTRELVLTTALGILDESGFTGLSLHETARRLGIKTPSLYKHIGGLNDMLDEIGIRALHRLRARLEPLFCSGNPEQILRAILVEYAEFARECPGLYASIQPTLVNRSKAYQDEAAHVMSLFFRLAKMLNIAEEQQIHIVRAWRSLLHGFLDLEVNKGFGLPVNLKTSFEYLIDLAIRGSRV